MDLAERVVQLERRLQRLQIVGLVLAVGLGFVVLVGAQTSEPDRKTLEATSVRLVDQAGKLRGTLTVTPKGHSGLALFHENGRVGLTLGVAKDGGASLEMMQSSGALRARLSLADDGTPFLQFVGADGKVMKQIP